MRFFWIVPVLLPLVLLLLEGFSYPGLVATFFKVPVVVFVVAALLWLLALVLRNRSLQYAKEFAQALVPLFMVTAVAAISLHILEQRNFTNYVFSTFHFHAQLLGWIPLYVLAVLSMLSVSLRSRLLVSMLPGMCMVVVAVIKYSFPEAFLLIAQENGILEVIQLLILAVIAVCSSLLFVTLILRKQYSLPLFFSSLAAVAALLFIGEELAWGQYLLGFEPSDFFKYSNVQGEMTFHNIDDLQDGFFLLYIIVGFVAGSGWLMRSIPDGVSELCDVIKPLFPPAWIATFFWPLLGYGLVREFHGQVASKTWEESAELLAFLGVLFTVIYWAVLQGLTFRTHKNLRT